MLAIAARAGLLAAVIAGDALAPVRTSAASALAGAGVPEPLWPALVAGLCALLLGAGGEILAFPFVCRAEWSLARRYDRSPPRFPAWCGAHWRKVLVTSGSWVAAALVAYSAMALWAEYWWLAAAAAFAAGTVSLAVFGPRLLRPGRRVRPLRCPELAARLEALARRAAAPVTGVGEWAAGATSRANAALVGVGSARRVLLTDSLVEDYSDAEIEVVVAHELAHHVHRDIWKAIVFRAAVVCAACWAAHRAVGDLGPALGLDGVADAAALPALALCAGAVVLAALPAANLLSRHHERRADRFALDLTGNHEAFVSGLRRLGDEHFAEERPPRLVKWCFYSHPPVAERVAAARRHLARGAGRGRSTWGPGQRRAGCRLPAPARAGTRGRPPAGPLPPPGRPLAS